MSIQKNAFIVLFLSAFVVVACAATNPVSPNTSTNSSSTNTTNNSANNPQFPSSFQGTWTNLLLANDPNGFDYYNYNTYTVSATNFSWVRITKSNNLGIVGFYDYRYTLVSNFSTSLTLNSNTIRLRYLCQSNGSTQTALWDLPATSGTNYYCRVVGTISGSTLVLIYGPNVMETNYANLIISNYSEATSTNYLN